MSDKREIKAALKAKGLVIMKKEMFDELLASVQEMDGVVKGKKLLPKKEKGKIEAEWDGTAFTQQSELVRF